MAKSKSSRTERTKPSPDRPDRHEARGEERVSDGVVAAELDERDTDKYEPPGRTYR